MRLLESKAHLVAMLLVRLLFTIVMGIILLVLGDMGLSLAKAQADAADVLLVSDCLAVVLVLMMSVATASASGRILAIPTWWNAGAVPILLWIFAFGPRYGILLAHWDAIDSVLMFTFGRNHSYSSLITLVIAAATGGFTTVAAARVRRAVAIASTAFFTVILLSMFIIVSYSQMVAEVHLRTEWSKHIAGFDRRDTKPVKPLRSQFVVPRRNGAGFELKDEIPACETK